MQISLIVEGEPFPANDRAIWAADKLRASGPRRALETA
jgi:hypothetical protein